MGLLIKLNNGDTQLKSLKFGQDRPGGGDSGQPYIQKQIFDKTPSPWGTDFLLRGGAYAPFSAAEDVVRLTKYMFDKNNPSGLLFVAKQNLLSRTGVKTEASKGAAYLGGAINEGVYTPLSTLAEAGIGFTGAHVYKQGLDPTGLFPGASINKYDNVLKNQPKDENKLVRLQELILAGRTGKQGFNSKITLNTPTSVMTYGGGPGSILGVGNTYIRYADQRTGEENPLFKTDKKYFLEGGLTRPKTEINYDKLLGASKKENLTNSQIGIDLSTQTNYNLYGPHTDNSTIGKSNSSGYSLSGSGGYQIGDVFKYQTQEKDTTYYSQIEAFVSKVYNRQLTSNIQFDTGKVAGNANTWAITSNGTLIPKYSSENTLTRAYTNTEIQNQYGNALWDEFNKYYGYGKGNVFHKTGYLADLDKNAGTFLDVKSNIVGNNNAAYPGGIAPDFRLVPRTVRGLAPFSKPQKYDDISSKSDNGTVTKELGEVSTTWIPQGGKYLKENTLDRIYYSSNSIHKSSFRTSTNLNNDNDLIVFKISVIDPENPSSTPDTMRFRAYLDGINDSYDANWKGQNYMGRAEKFWKYQEFNRDMTFSFTIVADNKDNLNTMYEQLNTLASSLAPTYTGQGYMAGNLHQVTIGNYIKDQYGIITGFTYEIMDESPWDLDAELPFYIKVNGVKFTPIHNFRPESQFSGMHQFINQ
jgi:hypothetical protein